MGSVWLDMKGPPPCPPGSLASASRVAAARMYTSPDDVPAKSVAPSAEADSARIWPDSLVSASMAQSWSTPETTLSFPSPQPQYTSSLPFGVMVVAKDSRPPLETGTAARKTIESALKTQSSPADEPAMTKPDVPACTYFAQKYSRSNPADGILNASPSNANCICWTSYSSLYRQIFEDVPTKRRYLLWRETLRSDAATGPHVTKLRVFCFCAAATEPEGMSHTHSLALGALSEPARKWSSGEKARRITELRACEVPS
mmetsp:Transcript_9634/g.29353  ORF Transcript_9634/g.29353 Transcript_9634/m.29353 type:complete len:258 (+) Transcript_9634:1183-1956(+)